MKIFDWLKGPRKVYHIKLVPYLVDQSHLTMMHIAKMKGLPCVYSPRHKDFRPDYSVIDTLVFWCDDKDMIYNFRWENKR